MPERVQRKYDSETPVEFFDLKFNNTYIDNFDYYHAAERLCKLDKGDDKKLMIVVILSDTSEGSSFFRQAIRETWGGVRRLFGWSLRFAFIIGENKDLQRMSKIANESEVYGDIVQGRFDDTYLNITDKTIASFRWTQEHCSNAIYMMRITQDTVLNPQKLIGWANEFYNHNSTNMRLYFGAPLRGSPIIYDQNHKNRLISPVKWPKKYYPAYQSGCGFISSLTFIRDLNAMFCRTPITAPDDGYVGAIAEALGVTIYEHPLFAAHYTYLNKKDRGTINSEATFVHLVAIIRPEDIYDVMVDVYQTISGYTGPPSNTSSMTEKHTVVL
ncbi:unnamed protein product [Owenia fusiformis]|uniref:Hexosyltransferase n=1 Tax=Owenia fusiformis TaxID=6347 RepID=A0A8J1Y5A8_OWEFU|nr:unnamed protein product [Owenia fusiformis]